MRSLRCPRCCVSGTPPPPAPGAHLRARFLTRVRPGVLAALRYTSREENRMHSFYLLHAEEDEVIVPRTIYALQALGYALNSGPEFANDPTIFVGAQERGAVFRR